MRTIKKLAKFWLSPKYRYLNRFKIRKGDVVIDLGANVGEVTEYFLSRGAEVHAYEPNPHAFKILQKRARKAKLYNAAVSPDSGMSKLWLHQNHNQSEIEFSQSSSLRGDKSNVSKDYIEVETISISKILQFPSIRLLKIDIEGGEYDIMDTVLSNLDKIDYVVLETHATKNPAFHVVHDRLMKQIEASVHKNKIYLDWF